MPSWAGDSLAWDVQGVTADVSNANTPHLGKESPDEAAARDMQKPHSGWPYDRPKAFEDDIVESPIAFHPEEDIGRGGQQISSPIGFATPLTTPPRSGL